MSWCLQCGAEGRPTRATGVDEDGEPACVGHAVKEFGAGLNAAAGRPVPAVPAPIKQPAAAPSPVQTKAEDEMGTQSQGLRPRSNCKVCGREIADFVLEKHMRAKHGGDPTVARPKDQKDCDLKPAGGVYVERMQTAPMNESVINLQLSLRQTQVERLIKLLL